jgi:hypothetical protein
MAPLPLGVEVSISAVPEMTRVSPSRRWAPLSPGAVFALMAWMLFAPSDVQAGCSHLVTSRTDRTLLPMLLESCLRTFPSAFDARVSASLPGCVVRRRPGRPGDAFRNGEPPRRIVGLVHGDARPGLGNPFPPHRGRGRSPPSAPRHSHLPAPATLRACVKADRPIESRWIRSPGRALQRTPATSSAARRGLDSGPRP